MMDVGRSNSPPRPLIGILGWEAGNPDTLAQLEQIPGNIAHPGTFRFPVAYRRIAGAHYQTVVVRPSREVLKSMIRAAREMRREGIRAVTTSCGFNAVFQQELAAAVDIPVFASSLIQVPLVRRMLAPSQRVGILTASERCLTAEHLEKAGVTDEIPIRVAGLESSGEFSRILADPQAELNLERLAAEVVEIGRRLVENGDDVGALVLECTDLPPFAPTLRQTLGLPVFDIVTLTNWVHAAIVGVN
jgi:Asp/Glu/hydantoin racemase